MNKFLLIGGVLVVIVIGALSISNALKGTGSSDATPRDTSSVNEEKVEEVTPLSGEGTFAELIGLGKNIRCEVSYSPEEIEGSVDGVVYVSGEQMRADILMTTTMGNMRSSIIHTETKGYVWGVTPFGEMAMVFDSEREDGTASGDEAFDLDERVDYSCKSWNVDESKFVPPADIQFVDMKAQMEAQMNSGIGGNQESQCGMCEQIPDENARTQCLAALQCN